MHLTQGYTLNQAHLAEKGMAEAQLAIELLARTLQTQALVNDAGREVFALIAGYAKTWRLLLQYDETKMQRRQQVGYLNPRITTIIVGQRRSFV